MTEYPSPPPPIGGEHAPPPTFVDRIKTARELRAGADEQIAQAEIQLTGDAGALAIDARALAALLPPGSRKESLWLGIASSIDSALKDMDNAPG